MKKSIYCIISFFLILEATEHRSDVINNPKGKPTLEHSVKNTVKPNSKKIETRTVILKTNINNDMLTYHHWTGPYAPSTFNLKVNNQHAKTQEQKEIILHDNDTFNIDYEYEFKVMNKVRRQGGKHLSFKVPQNQKEVTLRFSWDDKNHIIASGAQLIACNDKK